MFESLRGVHCGEDAGILEHHLDLSNLWRLLLMYRHREGMRSSELELLGREKAPSSVRGRSPHEKKSRLSRLLLVTSLRSWISSLVNPSQGNHPIGRCSLPPVKPLHHDLPFLNSV